MRWGFFNIGEAVFLCVINRFFAVETPSQPPDDSVDDEEQNKAKQDCKFALIVTELPDLPYPKMNSYKVNARRDEQRCPESGFSPH